MTHAGARKMTNANRALGKTIAEFFYTTVYMAMHLRTDAIMFVITGKLDFSALKNVFAL
jgi:hypothetical protein